MATDDQTKPYRGLCYVGLSFALWMLFEYLTVWRSKLGEWVSLMPYVLIQYVVIILIFWYFAFRRKWSDKKLFFLMLGVMYFSEFLWGTPFLLNPITFIPGSLLLASIWGCLTLLPLWIIRGEVRRRKLQVFLCVLWMPVGFVVAIIIG